jgi:hypothetical protein
MLDVLATVLTGGAFLLFAIAGSRTLLVHENDGYKRYLRFAGISIWLVVILAVAFWITLGFALGALVVLLIGLAVRWFALYLWDRYLERIGGGPPPDEEQTQFLVAVGSMMVLLAFLVALVA